ncbi:ATP-binding protein [Billgrantia kenyensis]|uniref:histidine kinase n=1 Tax=Billgrantia kenyensis TaxID=321266 RepID=A0A7W0AC74_9GAMM|nr:ATP-binding protein [Halomonas kenyensis]MBA2777683.1 CHASE3 domain-containing protein [Halomonas kenyensis]MCG6660353.1 PAS domain-containing protein [Halomonas kenyensis]
MSPVVKRLSAVALHRLASLLAFVLLIVLALQAGRVQQALLEVNETVDDGLALISAIQDLQVSLLEVETGERGFVITGRSDYLIPYRNALERLDAERSDLVDRLESGGRMPNEQLSSLTTLIDQRVSIADSNIEVRESDGLEAAALRLLAAGGRQTMVRIRDILDPLKSRERELLAFQNDRAAEQAARARQVAIIGVAFVVVLFVAAYGALNRVLAIRRQLLEDAEHREARLQALLHTVPDELYVIDAERGIHRLVGEAPVTDPFACELHERLGESGSDGLLHSFVWHDPDDTEYEVRMLPTRDGEHLVIARDITDRLRSRRRLRDQQMYLRRVVDADENLIFSCDADGRFLLCNQSFAGFFGLQPSEVEGRRVSELDQAPLLRPLSVGDSELLAGRDELRVPELKILDSEGNERWLQMLKRPLTLSDGSQHLLTVAVDITQRREMERMKAEFIATVSHELRTPLTAVKGALGMLQQGYGGKLPDDARTLVQVAEKNGQRLVHLIDDILAIEKLEAGQLEVRLQRVELTALVEQALIDNKPYADGFGVTLELQRAENQAQAALDPHRFAQVLANLISNACKHSPSGAVVMVVIRSVTNAAADWWEVAVRDAGEGIPLEFQPRVFERFAQADSSDRRRIGGTGLGLSITRGLVHAMNGEIDFNSVPGDGSEFRVRFPALAGPGGHANQEQEGG